MTDEARDHGGSPERFGFSWALFSEILPQHQEQFRRWSSALPREAWQGARFVDAGCGIGRNSYWAMAEGAASGIALDIDGRSLAAAAARRNLAPLPAVEVRNQSIYEIVAGPPAHITFSIGVIHHLGDPVPAIRRMVSAVKPGGAVLIWVYGRENNGWLVRFFDPLRRALFSRLPPGVVYHLSLSPSALLWLALRLGLARIEYLRLLRSFSFPHLRAIVFDQMIPCIAHYWRCDTVETLMRDAGLADIRLVWVNEMSWSAVGKRPS